MGLRAHEDDRIRILLGAEYCRSDGSAACLSIGVIVIARDEDHHGIRVPPQYVKESHSNRNTSAAV